VDGNVDSYDIEIEINCFCLYNTVLITFQNIISEVVKKVKTEQNVFSKLVHVSTRTARLPREHINRYTTIKSKPNQKRK
jgi:hypothetical protein